MHPTTIDRRLRYPCIDRPGLRPRKHQRGRDAARRWLAMETLEQRLLLTGVLDNLAEVFIEREVLHGMPGDPQEYAFEFGFELQGPDVLSNARFQSSGGAGMTLSSTREMDGSMSSRRPPKQI